MKSRHHNFPGMQNIPKPQLLDMTLGQIVNSLFDFDGRCSDAILIDFRFPVQVVTCCSWH